MLYNEPMIKKLLIYLILLSPLSAVSAQDDACKPQNIDIWTHARIAQAGNLMSVDGRQLRLTGVYAPEMGNPSKRNDPPRPLSRESQTFLNRTLASHKMRIGIQYDKNRVDAFGRPEAHVFLEDGTNINALMIENGLALALASPPNLGYQACYVAAEQRARKTNRGLWRLPLNSPELKYPLVLSSDLSDLDTGFRIIHGTVRQVLRTKNNYVINFDTTGIRVQREHWSHFDFAQLEALKGQEIEVRGFAFAFQGSMYMVIDHPSAIDKLNPYLN